jgi:Amt family ammonium transporter
VDGNVTGLFYGDAGQFFAQCIGGLANFIGVGLLTLAAYGVTSLLTKGHRVSAEVEDVGLDIPEMGVLAYPEGVSLGDPSAPLAATVMGGGSRAAA